MMSDDIILNAVLKKLGKKYEYKKFLGGGGYSNVYLIRHTMFGEDHALKIMDYDYIKKRLGNQKIRNLKKEFTEIKERFINEAKLYKRIRHPNIVGIHDIDVIEDEKKEVEIPYITMDYINIKGSSLDRILENKAPLEWNIALNISMNVLGALDAIHKEKIIHRDIKPANLMIKENTGEAILIDFGLAKDKLNETTLTSTGVTIGTPAYMSPEQITNPKNIGSNTDIYSFGVVLYEMLTGDLPFGREKDEIFYAHLLKDPPNVREKNPDLPVGIEDIICKAMARNPKNRYEGAKDFRMALNKVEETREMIIREKKEETTEEIKPKYDKEEKKAREVELRQEEQSKIETAEKEKIAEAKIENEKRNKVDEEKKEGEIGKREEFIKIKDKEKIKKETKARKIKDSDEVKRLPVVINEGLENERKNGEREYKAIKDKLLLSQFDKAIEAYISGQYDSSKKRLERVTDSIKAKHLEVEKKDILGKYYLLIGAISEKRGETLRAEENYRRAKGEYGIEAINGVDLNSLPIYKSILGNKNGSGKK